MTSRSEERGGGQTGPASSALGIYIHIPFCLRKCSYCDFYSLPVSTYSHQINLYSECLVREIRHCDPHTAGTAIDSIYLGGGTPSLLEIRQLAAILDEIRQRFKLLANCEVTLEANPATLTPDKLKGMRSAGVNRISLGVQSFQNQDLKVLGRMHDEEQALSAVEMLRQEGFTNINLDLIYGIPGQTMERWMNNLVRAVQSAPAHLSLYLLQLEMATPLARAIQQGTYRPNEEEADVQMYLEAINYLNGQGFGHYEISNWSIPGYRCRHNLRYWEAREYIGFGAGAVSFMYGSRYMNKPDLTSYLESWSSERPAAVISLESMKGQEVVADALILGLRLCEGIDLRTFSSRFGAEALQPFNTAITRSVEDGLLKLENERLKLTKPGYMLSNIVFRRILN